MNAMALTFHFKAGEAQSREAGHYFGLVANEILVTGLGDLEARQIVITQDEQPPMPLRLWAADEPTPEELGELAPWIRRVHADMHSLRMPESRVPTITALMQRWVETRHGDRTFFAELLDPAHAFTPDEDNVLSLAVIGGEAVMLSTRNVMYVKLDRDRFGLAIAGKGSFLIERVSGNLPHAQRA